VSLPARSSRAASPVNSAYDLACAAATAAALIELALSESQRPVGELGEALSRVSAAVSAGRPPAAADLEACVECLQFHDRLVQQLSQVRDLLAAVAAAGESAPGGRQSWPVLMENLRARFTSESHRILFNLLMPDAEGRSHVPSLHASEGSVELF
jgi:plasmid stabilization system protein ParE